MGHLTNVTDAQSHLVANQGGVRHSLASRGPPNHRNRCQLLSQSQSRRSKPLGSAQEGCALPTCKLSATTLVCLYRNYFCNQRTHLGSHGGVGPSFKKESQHFHVSCSTSQCKCRNTFPLLKERHPHNQHDVAGRQMIIE